jgi:hypothetical protein
VAAARPVAHDPITTKITFTREIRAILSARCVTCHAPGGSAPMPLTTYEEVRPWARAIKEQVLTRRMPKWHAARGFGAFQNDPTLTPIELAMIVSWVDGGLPLSTSSPRPGSGESPSVVASAFPGRRSLGEGGRRKIDIWTPAVTVPAGASEAAIRGRSRWVAAWSFEPGDPLITTATVTSDGGVVGTWVAGDGAITMPAGTALRVWGRVRVQLQRREASDYEQPFTAKRSVVRFTTRSGPVRRVWTEHVGCGSPWTGRPAQLLAIRPMLEEGGAARIWIERGGAPKTIVGWFREFDPRFPRTYWLARPADFPAEARLSGSERCEAMLTLTSAR